MNNMRLQFSRFALLLKRSKFSTALNYLRARMHSDIVRYCLRRDLAQAFDAPPAKIPIIIDPIREDDAIALFGIDGKDVPPAEILDRTGRMGIFRKGIVQGYVARSLDGVPCYAQWLMSPAQNDLIQQYFGGLFPVLRPDEALLEAAFTPASHRGLGIMSRAMALMAERARDFGARYVITFVDEHNIASLKGCQRAGFLPHSLLKVQWRWFRRRLVATPLPAATPYPYEADSRPKAHLISPAA